MLLLTVVWFGRALENCSLPVHYLYNSATNEAVPADSWFYFYSDYIALGDVLKVRFHPTGDSADLYKGDGLLCPGDGDNIAASAQDGRWGQSSFAVSQEIGLQIFGIKVGQHLNTSLVVSVEGKNPNNADLDIWLIVTSLFLAITILLLVALFVHAIMARGRVHYQVEVEE
jgi:hypothetical protein